MTDVREQEQITLAIDPSINSLGWARFIGQKLDGYGTIKGGLTSLPLEKRIEHIIDRLFVTVEPIMSIHIPHYVVIEKPKLWGSVKSVASQHSGSLLGLHITVGALYWWGRAWCQEEAIMIPVNDWKGQLPKDVTTRRMEKKYKTITKTHDEADAIGIGDYFVNKLLPARIDYKELTNGPKI